MTRIIAGVAKGRTLAVPPRGTRPTSDKVREAIFSAVASRIDLADTAVLDLYAGSGALGLEAASRGARSVVLVEVARSAAAVVRANARTTGLPARVVQDRAERVAGVRQSEAPFDLVLIDPPYATPVAPVAGVLRALGEAGNLHLGTVIVLEYAAKAAVPAPPPGWAWEPPKTYGDTMVRFAGAER